MGPKIIIILFLVLLLGLVIYLVNSGVAGEAFTGLGGVLKIPTSTVHYGTPGMPQVGTGGGGSAASSGGGSGDGSYYTNPPAQPAVATSEIPIGFTRAQLSPWFHQVHFGGVSAGAFGQITLSTYFANASSSVDVTGWRIVANRGGEYVPQAVNLYDPSGLTAPSDIVLRSGDYVNLYSQSGPFNIRLNKCIGYIGNQNKTNPSLSSYCPRPDLSAISNFTGVCQNFIYGIGSCQVPDLNSTQIPFNDYACRNFIANNFNYRACYDAHVSDADFLSNEWRAWMGASPLDPYHDNVYLYDHSGLLVDTYKY